MSVMLAHNYKYQDPTNWLISEKLDGVRANWTGLELISRNEKKFFAPNWFIEQLPKNIELDGELYIGRGRFQQTISTVRKLTPIDLEWQDITYKIFEAPNHTFDYCQTIIKNVPFVEMIEYEVCTGVSHLEKFYNSLIAQGAEGIMLRKPNSPYERKRSHNLLKLKPSYSDEAIVIGHETGEGRNKDRLGALVCTWQSITFNIGTGLTDSDRNNPPEIGSKVTFGFSSLTDAGIPRFPVFVAVRDYE